MYIVGYRVVIGFLFDRKGIYRVFIIVVVFDSYDFWGEELV